MVAKLLLLLSHGGAVGGKRQLEMELTSCMYYDQLRDGLAALSWLPVLTSL